MAMGREKRDFKEIDVEALDLLVARVQHAIDNDLSLSIEDLKLLLEAISTLCALQQRMEDKNVTLHKLRKLLGMVQSSERRRSPQAKAANNKARKQDKGPRNKKRSRKKLIALVEHHKAVDYEKGQTCPDCQRGKLYKYEPGSIITSDGSCALRGSTACYGAISLQCLPESLSGIVASGGTCGR